jgi:glutamate dehydrogenase
MTGVTKDYLKSLREHFLQVGIAEEIAHRIATSRAIYTALNVVEVATRNKFDLVRTAHVYFLAGERVNLVWFRDQIANDSREGQWNNLARLTLRDELDFSQRALTVAIISKDKTSSKDAETLINAWMNKNRRAILRWERILTMLHGSANLEYSMFFIAIRELFGLIMTSE